MYTYDIGISIYFHTSIKVLYRDFSGQIKTGSAYGRISKPVALIVGVRPLTAIGEVGGGGLV